MDRQTDKQTDVYNNAAHDVLVYSVKDSKNSVALTERNLTGPPCIVGRPTAHAPGQPADSVTDDNHRQRRQQMTDASKQNDTGPLGGPVTSCSVIIDNIKIKIVKLDC